MFILLRPLKQFHLGVRPLEIPAMTRLAGRMFRANIAFDDHPPERRWADKIDTVTVDAVFSFVTRRDAASTRMLIRLD